MYAIAAAVSPTTRRILRAASRAAAVIAVLGATACVEPPTAPRRLDLPDDAGGVLMPPNDGAWTAWNVANPNASATSANPTPRRAVGQP
jgi:hypothetical protein